MPRALHIWWPELVIVTNARRPSKAPYCPIQKILQWWHRVFFYFLFFISARSSEFGWRVESIALETWAAINFIVLYPIPRSGQHDIDVAWIKSNFLAWNCRGYVQCWNCMYSSPSVLVDAVRSTETGISKGAIQLPFLTHVSIWKEQFTRILKSVPIQLWSRACQSRLTGWWHVLQKKRMAHHHWRKLTGFLDSW